MNQFWPPYLAWAEQSLFEADKTYAKGICRFLALEAPQESLLYLQTMIACLRIGL